MLDRDRIIDIIDGVYAAREAGDIAAMNALWAEGATYSMEGEAQLLFQYPTGPGEAAQAVQHIADLFKADMATRVTEVVEGNRAAVIWRASFSTQGNAPREMQLFNLWEFNDAGHVVSVREFGDTALIAAMLAE